MAERGGRFSVLLDQNVPAEVARWLASHRPEWRVVHASETGLQGATDREVFAWAQRQQAVIVTFDEDFADQRSFPVGTHCGVVRLRVWPTTVEEVESALRRLLEEVSEEELSGALVIVDRRRIRVWRPRR